MGNSLKTKSNVTTVKVGSNPKQTKRSSTLSDFKITQADLVKQKRENINDDYTFLETLGKGAFGEVKKGVHKTTGVIRAIKVLDRKRQEKDQYDKMMNEIQIVKNLDHPHIMKVIEFYQDDAKLYIISEFYDGGELFDKIAVSNTFTEAKAAKIMEQLFSAINYCHQHKIVHRDLKPENIMYDTNRPDATLKIIDFGISQAFITGEMLHKPLGTCYYVAPEVLKKNYTEKCDMWSCGTIMYFILCGHPPFVGSTQKKVLERVAKGLYEFKDTEWKDISPEAIDLIRKLLEFSPEKRLTAEEALSHPWFKLVLGNKDTEKKSVAKKNLKNLQDFRTDRKLQEAIWIFFVTYFSTKDDTAKLLGTFRDLDKDKNGILSKEELKEGYKKIMGKAQNDEDIEELIKNIDNNDSGAIDYSEFVTATTNKLTMLSKARLEAAFKLFDKDNNGYLTANELKDFLNPEQLKTKKHLNEKGEIVSYNEDEVWNELVVEVDTNQDGKISLTEFKNMMLKLLK